MKRLADCAARTGAQFEIYACSQETRAVSIENSEVKGADASLLSGVSLRLLKDGLAGFSFTSGLNSPEGLVENALKSLKSGVRAAYSFPGPENAGELKTFSARAVGVTAEDMLAESSRISGILAKRSRGQVNSWAQVSTSDYRIINSSGLDVSWKESLVETGGSLVCGSGSRYQAASIGFDLEPISGGTLERAANFFEAGRAEANLPSGRYNVLFMPCALNFLIWRLQSGVSGKSLHQNISPLAGKVGEKVFSGNLTIRNNPLDDSIPGARSFDDEGVPCADSIVADKGVFRGFCYDLNYAAKTGAIPTGHGFRRTMLGGGSPVMRRPEPCLGHLCFGKGERTFEELIREMGTGIVVLGALGDHTGDIPNGDFSIGLSPGLCVENGRIAGAAKGMMLSGNIYEMLKRVIAVGSEQNPAYGNNPPLLFEGVDVSS